MQFFVNIKIDKYKHMTEKQEERLRKKIKQIKSELAFDKKRWGGYYDDSRGLRYLPLEYYIKLKDYPGGKRYLNWFYKNFPDDAAFPEFLFECCIILFYSKKLKAAQKKLFETFSSNIYVIDKFLGKEIIQSVGSDIQDLEYLNYFKYSSADKDLMELSEWVKEVLRTDLFISAANKLISIQKELQKEKESNKRKILIEERNSLADLF
jgi:hypothetical protein